MAISARRRKAKEAKKGAILKAARGLFLAKGFSDVTVDNIAKKVDISKGAVYLHFNSKDEIYVNILSSEIDRFCKNIGQIPSSSLSAKEAIKKFASFYIDFFLDEPEIFRIFISFMLFIDKKSRHHDELYKLVQKARTTITVVNQIIKRGIEQGDFSPDIDEGKLLNAIWGLLNGSILLYIFVSRKGESEKDIRSTVDSGLDAIIAGISVKKLGALDNKISKEGGFNE